VKDTPAVLTTAGVTTVAVTGTVTVRVTVTVCGLLLATPDSTGTVAEYVPAPKEPVVGWSVSVAGADVVFSVELSQPPPPAP